MESLKQANELIIFFGDDVIAQKLKKLVAAVDDGAPEAMDRLDVALDALHDFL